MNSLLVFQNFARTNTVYYAVKHDISSNFYVDEQSCAYVLLDYRIWSCRSTIKAHLSLKPHVALPKFIFATSIILSCREYRMYLPGVFLFIMCLLWLE